MNDALRTVVRAFQSDVQRALGLFRYYWGVDDLRDWRRLGFPGSGYLAPSRKHRYYFHGIGVCLELEPDLHIDWDFGHGDRMDGFDHWRLQIFVEERPELQRILPVDSLRCAFDTAVRDGSIVSPWREEHDNLYYVADDLRPDGRV